jgi:hypothetical protein
MDLMGIVGVIILATVLFISVVNLVLAYICLILASPVQKIASEYRPRRKVVRTLYAKDWDRIAEMTKLEKAGRKK